MGGIPPLIDVEGVGYAYPVFDGSIPVAALEGIDLEVSAGEFVAIVGSNGSGKSTLAKHLNGLLLPDRGRVTVAGMVTDSPQSVWEIRRRVGMVFQNPDNQMVASIVEDDVAFGPENLGLPPAEIRRRVMEALHAVRAEELRPWAPHLLSGGQKQRVAIAGVLAMRPEVLVLDEPTSMLDPVGREEVLQTITRLHHEEGLTIILITHFMEEAALSDRVVALQRGRILADTTPRTLFRNHDLLDSLGLEPPPVVQLARLLAGGGLVVPEDCLSVAEMVDVLCGFWSTT